MIMMFKKVIYKLKQAAHYFLPSNSRRRIRVLKKTKKYNSEVVRKLKDLGFKRIKKYSVGTWKFYGDNHVRMTYLSVLDGRKCIIKVTKGFEIKSKNSIVFQQTFNDRFSFIPKGKEINIDGYIAHITEYIDSYSFSEAISVGEINEKNIRLFLKQANEILDELNSENIVHCDLADVNLLIEKKTNKMYLIDWDTVCSYKYNLVSNGFPHNKTTQKNGDKYIYDDAYAFCCLFNMLKIQDVTKLEEYKELEKKIGRNTFTAKY